MLDFGCGQGRQLAQFELSHPHISYVGYEPYMQGKVQCNAPIYNNLDDLKGKKFHIVSALDVIEHIEDDSGALSTINDLLLPDGLLLITVPAYQYLYSSLDEMQGHYRRYSHKTLTTLVSGAGFKVIECFYIFPYLFVPYLCLHKCLADIMDAIGVRYNLNLHAKITPTNPLKMPSLLASLELAMIKKTKLRSPFGISLFLHAIKIN